MSATQMLRLVLDEAKVSYTEEEHNSEPALIQRVVDAISSGTVSPDSLSDMSLRIVETLGFVAVDAHSRPLRAEKNKNVLKEEEKERLLQLHAGVLRVQSGMCFGRLHDATEVACKTCADAARCQILTRSQEVGKKQLVNAYLKTLKRRTGSMAKKKVTIDGSAPAEKNSKAAAKTAEKGHRSRGDNPPFDMKQAKTEAIKAVLSTIVEKVPNVEIRTAPKDAHFSVLVGGKNAMNIINGAKSSWIGLFRVTTVEQMLEKMGLSDKDFKQELRVANSGRWVEIRGISDETPMSSKATNGIVKFCKWFASSEPAPRASRTPKDSEPKPKKTGKKAADAPAPAAEPVKTKKASKKKVTV